MKTGLKKFAPGFYEYRGVTVTLDSAAPTLGWSIIWGDQKEHFDKRSEAMHQIDRYLNRDPVDLAKAPTSAELAKIDLSDYITDDLLVDVQRRLADLGLSRSRAQLTQAAENGSDGVTKRIMLTLILAGLLGL